MAPPVGPTMQGTGEGNRTAFLLLFDFNVCLRRKEEE